MYFVFFIFHFLFFIFHFLFFIFHFSFFIFHFSFFIFHFLFFIFVFGKIFSIHGGRRIGPQTTQAGRKSSVPARHYSPRSNSAVSRKTISTFPENPPPRVSCSDFAPFLLRFSSVILQHGENHASETTERFLRFCSVFFCLKDTKDILQSWCAILVHGVGMPRPINLISSDI